MMILFTECVLVLWLYHISHHLCCRICTMKTTMCESQRNPGGKWSEPSQCHEWEELSLSLCLWSPNTDSHITSLPLRMKAVFCVSLWTHVPLPVIHSNPTSNRNLWLYWRDSKSQMRWAVCLSVFSSSLNYFFRFSHYLFVFSFYYV